MAGEWFSGVKNLEIDMKFIYSTFLLALLATGVHAADRLPTIAPENYTPEQKKAADDFMAADQSETSSLADVGISIVANYRSSYLNDRI